MSRSTSLNQLKVSDGGVTHGTGGYGNSGSGSEGQGQGASSWAVNVGGEDNEDLSHGDSVSEQSTATSSNVSSPQSSVEVQRTFSVGERESASVDYESASGTTSPPDVSDIFVKPSERAVDLMSKEWLGSTPGERLSVGRATSPSSAGMRRNKSFSNTVMAHSDTMFTVLTPTTMVGGNLDRRNIVRRSLEYHRTMSTPGEMSGLDQKELEKKTSKLLKSMEARQTSTAIKLLGYILTKLWRLLFRKIYVNLDGVKGLHASIKNAKPGTPVLLLPTHKSHIDYLVLSYVAFGYGLPLPHIAAGDNLDIPIVGALFRYSGSFFIRRKNTNDNLYRATLNTYLGRLLGSGACVEFFIEGGRSRSGKVGPPKVGLLKSVVELVLQKEIDDVLIVPVAVDYDRIPEGSSYATMSLGRPKVPESLYSLYSAAKVLLFRKHGSVHIHHGEGMSLKAIIGTKAGGVPYTSEDTRVVVDQVSSTISQCLTYSTTIMSSAVIATVMLAAPRTSYLSSAEIISELTHCIFTLHASGARLFTPGSPTDIFTNTLPDVLHMLEQRESFTGQTLYHVSSQRHLITELEMYKNMTMHVLLPEAIAAMSLTTATPIYHANFLAGLLDAELSGVRLYAKVLESIRKSRAVTPPRFLLGYLYPLLEAYIALMEVFIRNLNADNKYRCDMKVLVDTFLNIGNEKHITFIEGFTNFRVEHLVQTLKAMKIASTVVEGRNEAVVLNEGQEGVSSLRTMLKQLLVFINW